MHGTLEKQVILFLVLQSVSHVHRYENGHSYYCDEFIVLKRRLSLIVLASVQSPLLDPPLGSIAIEVSVMFCCSQLQRPSIREGWVGYLCPYVDFQNQSFCVLRKKSNSCWNFTIVFALFSVTVTVAVSTHLCVVCHHFCCSMSLFQGHVACPNFTLTGPHYTV